jgi:hypothetical protein
MDDKNRRYDQSLRLPQHPPPPIKKHIYSQTDKKRNQQTDRQTVLSHKDRDEDIHKDKTTRPRRWGLAELHRLPINWYHLVERPPFFCPT